MILIPEILTKSLKGHKNKFMEIIVSKNTGFCFGVKRAYELSLKTLEEDKECQMLGNLVHNEKVVNELKEKGLQFISSLEDIKEGTVIVRAHGVSDDVFRQLKEKGVKIVDATCPLVRKAQNFAKELENQGRKVIIIGEKDHAEVKAINGAIDNRGVVINSKEEVGEVENSGPVGVVIQTTQDSQRVEEFLQLIKERFSDVKVCDSLCGAVSERQKEVREIANKVDIILVVGSKTSANTQSLVNIIYEKGGVVYGVEDEKDIDSNWFKKESKVGLISGTSAPEWLVEKVKNKLEEIKNAY